VRGAIPISKARAGLTLLELLVTITIILILSYAILIALLELRQFVLKLAGQ
jgi:prepilin-type N-terminal cleavage/methylation domain-containing protein